MNKLFYMIVKIVLMHFFNLYLNKLFSIKIKLFKFEINIKR